MGLKQNVMRTFQIYQFRHKNEMVKKYTGTCITSFSYRRDVSPDRVYLMNCNRSTRATKAIAATTVDTAIAVVLSV